MGLDRNVKSGMQGLASKITSGDCRLLVNIMDEAFVSVSGVQLCST